MSHSALLVIDAQRAFEQDPEWDTPATTAWLTAQNALIAHAQHVGWPIARVLHHSRYALDPASDGVLPIDGLSLTLDCPQFIKHVHSALDADGLRAWLCKHTVSHLVISGIRTEQCCETTARAARDAGYDVDFALDATLTFGMANTFDERITSDAIKSHTATVLHRRFATVGSVAALIAREEQPAMNRHCPRSGRLVVTDALTTYRGHTVGFCNTGCRDSFAADPTACVADRRHFDRLVALREGAP